MSPLCWALGFAVGAGVALLNFWGLGVMVRIILMPGARAPRVLTVLGFTARLLVAGLLLGLALRYLPVSPVAMILGVSVVPVGLLARALLGSCFAASKAR
jgi:hypothetical protein